MTIDLTPDLEAALNESARKEGVSVEALVLGTLRERFAVAHRPTKSREEWEQLVRGIAIDCGVSLSNEALSSEGLYD